MKYEKGSPEHHAFLAHRREYLKARRAAMTPEQRDIERARCRDLMELGEGAARKMERLIQAKARYVT